MNFSNAHPEGHDDVGRSLVWMGAAPAAVLATRPQVEGERQLHMVLREVTAMLQREQRGTYRTRLWQAKMAFFCLTLRASLSIFRP
jgi:hypothetical protein